MNYVFKRLKFLNNRMVRNYPNTRWTRIVMSAGESNCNSGLLGCVARLACRLLCHLLQWVHRDLLWEGLLHCVEQECPCGQVSILKCKQDWIWAPDINFSGGRSILLTPLSPPLLAGKTLLICSLLFIKWQVLCVLLPAPLLPGLPSSWLESLLASLPGQLSTEQPFCVRVLGALSSQLPMYSNIGN